MGLESAFTTIFAAIGSSAALGIVAKLFANTIAKGVIKKYELVNQTKLETQKAEYQKEIESLKSQLSQLQKEHEVTFTSLYKKREDCITELYRLMLGCLSLADKKLEDFSINLETDFRALNDYFDHHRLYFPKDIALEINNVMNLGYKLVHEKSEQKYEEQLQVLRIEVFDQMEDLFRDMLKAENHR
ncbi:hypothetical protein PSH47_19900 [Pseudoalteromonas sp. CST5]|uniref:hypothetical protein n=1 Tax=unclassified Pseudoalteromonas TaxID=194690 RepID=UPI002359938D|nr:MULTISPECIES: hypothetical protein [unclassified Pseudoalteromonas]MDC9515410.1 hypothetical protein [Pseudoalteromonas sp. CST1]MDC9539732.1 hypothetical protein [Pseudoalteromonas sp. CST3]MDC9543612.1 hypothetical protein [Pseudoalteromonas sp. CST2]MDC9547422.1 hypothetical protein [Pseudoalteromonas sp. CST4]MDC9551392.1 hypothetical protein [Pseudoalteromonas sp. CST5]